MSSPPPNLPRFIPTLTEVVDPASLAGLSIPAKPDVEAMIAQVQQQLQPLFERRLQEELDRLMRATVARQWSDISARVRTEMDMLIRQAVIDMVGKSATSKMAKKPDF